MGHFLTGLLGYFLSELNWSHFGANSGLIRGHERNEGDYYALNWPNWVPGLRVEIRNRETNPLIHRKPTSLCHHHYRWRLPRVLFWEFQFAHVISIYVRRLGQTKDYKVPLEDIVGIWCSYKIIFCYFSLSLDLPIILCCQSFVLFC